MAIDTLTNWPVSMTAGDTVKVEKSFSGFSSATWTLTYYFLGGQSSSRFEIEATASGTGFLTTLTPVLTESVYPGTYSFHGYVVNSSNERATVDSGKIEIKPNLALSTQPQTWVQQALSAVEAALLKRLPKGMENFSINGKTVSRMSVDALYLLRDKLKSEVLSEERLRGQGRKRDHVIKFVNPR